MKFYIKPVLLSDLITPPGTSGLDDDGNDVTYTGGGSEQGGDVIFTPTEEGGRGVSELMTEPASEVSDLTAVTDVTDLTEPAG